MHRPAAEIHAMPPDALLTEQEAADYICHTIRALQAWRYRSQGPLYIALGRSIRYRKRDLDTWIDAHAAVGGGRGGRVA